MRSLEGALASGETLILDGGLSTQLALGGANLDDHLWSARLLLDDPEALVTAHRAFVTAGADVLIAASYQVSFEGFARSGISAAETADALRTSVSLAKRAATAVDREVFTAASVGPYGAILADGSEFRGDYDLAHVELADFHRKRIEILLESGPDLLAIETIPSITEARALVDVLAMFPEARAWFAFTCRDARRLADGSPFGEAIALVAASPNVVAVGVNCTSPRYIEGLAVEVGSITSKPIIVYPNGGGTWNARKKQWLGAEGMHLAELAPAWRAAGVNAIGGCCGTSAADIEALAGAGPRRNLSIRASSQFLARAVSPFSTAWDGRQSPPPGQSSSNA